MTVLFCTFAALAIILTITTFVMKESMLIVLGMASTFAWMVFTGVSYTIAMANSGVTDPYFYAFIFGIAMVITVPIATFELWGKVRRYEDIENEDREYELERRLEARAQGVSGADRLRLKHGMGLSMVRKKHNLDRETGWE